MALSIRLTRVGRRKSPFYRLVVAEARMPRDGRFVEIIGHYQPLRAETKLEIKEERALHWLMIGAQPSDTVRSLLRKKGIMQKWHEARLERKRARKNALKAEKDLDSSTESEIPDAEADFAPADDVDFAPAAAEDEDSAPETPDTADAADTADSDAPKEDT